VVTHPLTAHDNLALYAQFGQTFDRVAQAARLAQRMQAAIDRARARQWAPLDALYLIWKSPWMTVSNETYISDMLAQVGLKTIAPESTRRYPEIDWQDFPPSQADLVLFSSEPYRFRDHDAREFATEHRLAAHRCLTIDGEISSWYGPRAIGGLDALVRLRESIDAVIAAAETPRR
jgi:ABC-type Fe3+-hydroxamate transport system substrate-binding protein